jgi:hypothetical protein
LALGEEVDFEAQNFLSALKPLFTKRRANLIMDEINQLSYSSSKHYSLINFPKQKKTPFARDEESFFVYLMYLN